MRAFFYPFLLLSGILITGTVYSYPYDENTRMRFGRVDIEEVKFVAYPRDTGAAAVVLADYGTSYFFYNSTRGNFDVVYERHCRVKILKNSGYQYANIEVPTRVSGSTRELLSNLKASTYNLVNGKVVEHKLAKKDIFEDKSSESWTVTKFTMPNIEVGSIFEYSYKITSPFDIIRGWQFQMNIPVAWSEYIVKVPQYYKFHHFSQGYESFFKHERKNESASIIINLGKGQVHNEMYTNEVNYWAVKNAAALASEKFITTPNDFYTKIEFQIATIQMPYSHLRNILADWPEVQKKLLEHEKFGGQINRSGFMRSELQALVKDCPDNDCKVVRIYDFIRQNMVWNERRGFFCDSNVRKAFNDKIGNAAEINLMLVAALREADLQADPMILSTRDNGRIHPVYPIIGKFNYVIAAVRMDGKNILLDATDKHIVPGQLPPRCLNFQGRLISETNSQWVSLRNIGESTNSFAANVELEDCGTITGTVNMISVGYDAMYKRKEIMLDPDDYMKKLREEKKSWEIKSHNFENLENLSERLLSKFDVSISDAAQTAGSTFFLHPLLNEGFKENHFKQEKRLFPVDFVYPMNSYYQISINLPEHYEVDELPKNAIWALPDNGGTFSYNIFHLGNRINITVNYSLKKSFFTTEEYPALREFHNLIISKCEEQIVLKRKT